MAQVSSVARAVKGRPEKIHVIEYFQTLLFPRRQPLPFQVPIGRMADQVQKLPIYSNADLGLVCRNQGGGIIEWTPAFRFATLHKLYVYVFCNFSTNGNLVVQKYGIT